MIPPTVLELYKTSSNKYILKVAWNEGRSKQHHSVVATEIFIHFTTNFLSVTLSVIKLL